MFFVVFRFIFPFTFVPCENFDENLFEPWLKQILMNVFIKTLTTNKKTNNFAESHVRCVITNWNATHYIAIQIEIVECLVSGFCSNQKQKNPLICSKGSW